MAQLDWTRDELILAFDLVAQNGWRAVRSSDPRAEQLSRLLRSLPIHPVELREPSFRSVQSVQRKTYDIETGHPAYTGVRTKGNQLERQVLEDYIDQPQLMSAMAERLRELAG